MEQVPSQETTSREILVKNRLRTAQRSAILDDYFKDSKKTELIQELIPSDRQRSDTGVDEAGLRYLTEALGKNTHTALFNLAASAKDPMELYNILFNIADLKNVKSSTWKFKESEDHFLGRRLPEDIDISHGAENLAEVMLADKDAEIVNPDSKYILESLFYIISARNVPLEDKRRILNNFYAAKPSMNVESVNKLNQKTYGQESSFWSHVDGSWIDPNLAPVSAPKGHAGHPKKPNIASRVAKDINARLNRLDEEITQAPEIASLEGRLEEAEGLLKESRLREAKTIERTEQEGWQRVLGARVEIKPLPSTVTPEVRRNLERLGLELRYMPALDIGNHEQLREKGVEAYLAELQKRYPNWKPFESLDERERVDYRVSRNLEKVYWDIVRAGQVDFPLLPGQWMAVETVEKPNYGRKYPKTTLAEKLGFPDDRFNASWYSVHGAIDIEKRKILSEIGLTDREADFRLLETLEWNLLGNREGWGKTNASEWTNSKYINWSGDSFRIVTGRSEVGGASHVAADPPNNRISSVGFRTAIVLNS